MDLSFRKFLENIEPIDLDWARRHEVEITPDQHFILYHGTRFSKEIRTSGFFKQGTFFSNDPSYAAHAPYGSPSSTNKERRKIVVMKVKVDPNMIYTGIHCQAKVPVPVVEVP